MKAIAGLAATLLLAGATMAQSAPLTGADAGAACKTQAATLHGAALSSKIKSCCRQDAVRQKLHGAAQTGFRKSCEKAGLGA